MTTNIKTPPVTVRTQNTVKKLEEKQPETKKSETPSRKHFLEAGLFGLSLVNAGILLFNIKNSRDLSKQTQNIQGTVEKALANSGFGEKIGALSEKVDGLVNSVERTVNNGIAGVENAVGKGLSSIEGSIDQASSRFEEVAAQAIVTAGAEADKNSALVNENIEALRKAIGTVNLPSADSKGAQELDKKLDSILETVEALQKASSEALSKSSNEGSIEKVQKETQEGLSQLQKELSTQIEQLTAQVSKIENSTDQAAVLQKLSILSNQINTINVQSGQAEVLNRLDNISSKIDTMHAPRGLEGQALKTPNAVLTSGDAEQVQKPRKLGCLNIFYEPAHKPIVFSDEQVALQEKKVADTPSAASVVGRAKRLQNMGQQKKGSADRYADLSQEKLNSKPKPDTPQITYETSSGYRYAINFPLPEGKQDLAAAAEEVEDRVPGTIYWARPKGLDNSKNFVEKINSADGKSTSKIMTKGGGFYNDDWSPFTGEVVYRNSVGDKTTLQIENAQVINSEKVTPEGDYIFIKDYTREAKDGGEKLTVDTEDIDGTRFLRRIIQHKGDNSRTVTTRQILDDNTNNLVQKSICTATPEGCEYIERVDENNSRHILFDRKTGEKVEANDGALKMVQRGKNSEGMDVFVIDPKVYAPKK